MRYDSLTGLKVVQDLKGLLEEEVNQTTRNQRPLGIIMLDLDHLQNFNHRFGYDTGDQLLRQFGCLLQTVIRQGDIVYRFGNNEFILILREAPLHVVQRRAEQLRRTIRNLEVQKEIIPSEQVTLSLGVASFPYNGVTGEALLRAASTFLARAKAAGGDGIVSG
jgi:diguanylate cyclase (GGDEF)-like protein